jgi:hypothetical protein
MNLLRRLLPGIALIIGTFLVSIGFHVLAFTEPSAGPTGGTVYVPLNTGSNWQSKAGGLDLNTSGAYAAGLIVSSGNVGIGTASPGAKLEVAGQVKITGGTPGAGKILTSDASGLATWTTPAGGGGWTDDGSAVRLTTSTDNVGIGTASPSEKLHVNGNIYVGGNWYKSGNLTSVNNAISVWGGTGGMIVGNSGGLTVGMGMTSAGAAGIGIAQGSTVRGSFYTDDNETGMATYTGGPSAARIYAESSASFAGAEIIVGKTGYIDLKTNGGVGRLFINSSGNVGIGTASPGAKLEIGGFTNGKRLLIGQNSGDAGFVVSDNSIASGKFGAVFVHGQAQFDGIILASYRGGPIRFWTTTDNTGAGLTERVIILNNGNVGIGTTNPRTGLDVPAGGVFQNISIGNSAFGALSWGYETIQLPSNNNLRVAFGTTERFMFGSDGNAYKAGAGSWSALSDERLKTNINPITGALEKITALNGVNFEWKNPEEHASQVGEVRAGFIAQDVGKVFPQFINEIDASGKDKTLTSDGKVKSLTLPFDFDAYLVEAIKEQQKEIEALKADIEELKSKLK